MPITRPVLIELKRTTGVINIPDSIIAGGSLQTSLNLTPSFHLFAVECPENIRLRMYSRDDYRIADLNRAVTKDPTGNHGLLFEAIFAPGVSKIDLAPVVDVVNLEDSPSNLIPVTIDNQGVGDISNFDLTFTYFPIEY